MKFKRLRKKISKW